MYRMKIGSLETQNIPKKLKDGNFGEQWDTE